MLKLQTINRFLVEFKAVLLTYFGINKDSWVGNYFFPQNCIKSDYLLLYSSNFYFAGQH